MQQPTPRPTELRVSANKRTLTVSFADGKSFAIPAEALRVFSPSAEVQGHSPEQRKLVAGKRKVGIMKIVPTGNYAVRIAFDDMHDTGIFSWTYLYEMGTGLEDKMTAYEAELAEKGLSRDG